VQNVFLAAAFAWCGFVAGGLTARPDVARYVGAGAVLALGLVAIHTNALWTFALAATAAVVGMVRTRTVYVRQR